MLQVLSVDLKRAFLSLRFPAAVLGIAIVLLLSASHRLFTGLGSVYEAYHASTSLTSSEFFSLILFPLLPYSLSFSEDVHSGAARYWCLRVGTKKFCLSRLFVSVLAAICSSFLGLWLFIGILSPFFPVHGVAANGGPYGQFLQEGKPLTFFAFEFIHMSLSAALFSALAVLVSACVPNSFISLAFPTVLYIVALAVAQNLKTPLWFNLGVVMVGRYNAGSPLASVGVKTLNIVLRDAVIGYVAMVLMQRRMKC